jgi:hypothetical protein
VALVSDGEPPVVCRACGALEIAAWSTADGGDADQSSCTGGANQLWDVQYVSGPPTGPTNYLFVNINSRKCLHGAPSGSALYQVSCNSGDAAQVWKQHFKETSCTTCKQAKND